MRSTGLTTSGVDETMCCYAEKTETWVNGPDGNRWEWYVKRADSEQFENVVVTSASEGAVSSPGAEAGCC